MTTIIVYVADKTITYQDCKNIIKRSDSNIEFDYMGKTFHYLGNTFTACIIV